MTKTRQMPPLEYRKTLRQRMRQAVNTWYRTGDSQELDRIMSILLFLNRVATKSANGELLTDEEREFMRDVFVKWSRFNHEEGLDPPPWPPSGLINP